MKKLALLLSLLALAAFGVAACGDDDEESETTEAATTETTETGGDTGGGGSVSLDGRSRRRARLRARTR